MDSIPNYPQSDGKQVFFHELGHFIAETISLNIQGNTSFKTGIKIDKSLCHWGITNCWDSSLDEYRIASLLYGCIFEDLYNKKAALERPNFMYCFEEHERPVDYEDKEYESDYNQLKKIISNLSPHSCFNIYKCILGEALAHLDNLKNNVWESHMSEIFDLKAEDFLIDTKNGYYEVDVNSLMETKDNFIKNHKVFFVEFKDKIRSILNNNDI